MAVNTTPVFTITPNIGSGGGPTAANTSSSGAGTIGTDIFPVFTAGGSSGAWLREARFQLTATVAGTASTATVLRLFASSATSGATTTSNTRPLGELTVPSLTADSSTTAVYPLTIQLYTAIPNGWTVLVTSHAAPAANTLWIVTFPGAGDLGT